MIASPNSVNQPVRSNNVGYLRYLRFILLNFSTWFSFNPFNLFNLYRRHPSPFGSSFRRFDRCFNICVIFKVIVDFVSKTI